MQDDAIDEDEFEEDGFDTFGGGGLGGGLGDLSSRKFEAVSLHGPSQGQGRRTAPGHERKSTPIMDANWVLNATHNRKALENIKFRPKPAPQAGKLQLRPARQNRPRWDYTKPKSLYDNGNGQPTTSSSSTAELDDALDLPPVNQLKVNDAPKPQNVAEWSVARVRMWAVQSLQAKFVDKFCAKVDSDKTSGSGLLKVDDNWLKDAGFNVGFHRKVVMKRVMIIKKSHAEAVNGASSPGRQKSGSSPGRQKSVGRKLRVKDRVTVNGRAGTIRFIGDTHFGKDLVGVELTAPKGDNDGTFDGKRYFDCRPRHGVFTRASACELVR